MMFTVHVLVLGLYLLSLYDLMWLRAWLNLDLRMLTSTFGTRLTFGAGFATGLIFLLTKRQPIPFTRTHNTCAHSRTSKINS